MTSGAQQPPLPANPASSQPSAQIISFVPRKRPQKVRASLGPILDSLSSDIWSQLFGYDLFANRICFRPFPGAPWLPVEDQHYRELEKSLTSTYGVETSNAALVRRVAHDLAWANRFDPLLDYLNALQWDGIYRLPYWAEQLLGAKPTPTPTDPKLLRFSQLMPLKWLVGAVARAFEPGCKVDNVLVLEGSQGLRKSTALRTLAGDDFFLGHLPPISRGNHAVEVIRGRWIIEIDEMDGFDRARSTRVNSFITQLDDIYRAPYQPEPGAFPRRCVFAATTNESDWLHDHTGGRRFWPIHCTRIDIDTLAHYRDQLWAEAVCAYRNRVAYWITSPAEAQLAAAVVADRFAQDPWATDINAHLSYHQLPLVAVSALMKALGLDVEKRNPHDAARIAKTLKALHWEPVRCDVLSSATSTDPTGPTQRMRLWLRPSTPCPPDPVPRALIAL